MLESGRKPRVIGLWSLSGKSSMRGEGTGKSTYKKELRFDPLATPIPRPDYSALGPSSETGSVATTRSHQNNSNDSHSSSNGDQRDKHQRRTTYAYNIYASSEGTNTNSDEDDIGGPPSPSPRPGSAMSTISMSRTPTTTTTMLTMSGSMNNLTAATGAHSSHRANSVAGTSNLSIIPSTTSARAMNLDFKLGLPPAAAVDGRKKAATASLAIPSTRRHIDFEPHQSQCKMHLPVSLQNGSTLKPTHVDHDEPGDNNNNMSCLTECQSNQSQWEELEMRHAVMMEDIEDLEERFERLSASLM